MTLFKELEKSANLYPYFDYPHGYGPPHAGYFFGDTLHKLPTFEFSADSNTVNVKVNTIISENPTGILYYHIQSTRGYLSKYGVIEVSDPVIEFRKDDFDDQSLLRVHYQGFTSEYTF